MSILEVGSNLLVTANASFIKFWDLNERGGLCLNSIVAPRNSGCNAIVRLLHLKIACAYAEFVYLVDIDDLKCISTKIAAKTSITRMSLMNHGRLLAVITSERVGVWDLKKKGNCNFSC